ncbi:MAG: hypothetical protein KatS3mg033_0952 [Thermonema sp.]|jgi:uncharacterized membrane protein YjfL (UPF0719 family)|uniref:DUF350 domain-containing protein n=1 Tax=Thermonema sp. TaxID=2231181 RepID=UPI0021DDDADB|nr:hypothetical protein [Thermonema sp.]GIV39152.1 MAG: hypothetical protein KatS3mg033_0952 [Thermonema sp.]
MNQQLVFVALYETALSLIFGLLTLYLALKIVDKLILKQDSLRTIQEGNLAVAVFKGALVLSIFLMAQNSIEPSVQALKVMVLSSNKLKAGMLAVAFAYFIVFYLTSLVGALLLILISLNVYVSATKDIEEIEEIKNKNVAVAVLLSFVIVGVTIFIRPAFDNLITSFVDFSGLTRYEQAEGGRVAPSPSIQP